MANADVVLHQDRAEVQVQCENLNIAGHDVLLSSASRRLPGTTAMRRALVHDERDGLTLNFAGDYPAGVTVHGDLGLAAIQPLSRKPDDREDQPSYLLVRGGITYEVQGVSLIQGGPSRVQVSVGDEIEELHRLVKELAARVQALGG